MVNLQLYEQKVGKFDLDIRVNPELSYSAFEQSAPERLCTCKQQLIGLPARNDISYHI